MLEIAFFVIQMKLSSNEVLHSVTVLWTSNRMEALYM
jgi:hypothetical protein